MGKDAERNGTRASITRTLLGAHQARQSPERMLTPNVVARHHCLTVQSGTCKIYIADDSHGPADVTIEQGVQLRRIGLGAPCGFAELQQGLQGCRVAVRYLSQRTKQGRWVLPVVVDDAVNIGQVQSTRCFGMGGLAGVTNTAKYF